MFKGISGLSVAFILASLLVACGGGGDSSPTSPPTAIPTLPPTPTPTPTPTPQPTAESYSVSGSLTVASNTFWDSDNNDPFSEYSDNSTAGLAQALPNSVVLQGFVTEVATGVEGDRFESDTDKDDVFRVTLQEGQLIRLQVVDYDGFNIDSNFEGDIDIQLYDTDLNLLGFSESLTEFEEIQVPADGDYYILVYAYSGTSKYILHLMNNLGTSARSASDSLDFYSEEALVVYKNNLGRQKLATQLPSLVRFDATPGPQKLSVESPFSKELRSRNPEAFAKFTTLQQIKKLSAKAEVAAVSPNYRRYALATPNDEYFPLQWHYRAINLPAAWDITDGTGVSANDTVVAVIDTGVFLNHIELSNQLIAGYDFISDLGNSVDGNGIDNDPDDPGDSSIVGQSSWHGTHVAGTVAMLTNNSVGAAGIAPGAKIMPLRALGARGGSSYDIMQAVSFAAGLSNDSGTSPVRRADVINMSLGGPGFSQVEANFYQSLYNQGVIVVAAAGNDNSATLMYPASYNGVFSVSATDFGGNRAPYSNFGMAVDIAAPGGNTAADLNGDGYPDGVLSTLVDESSGTRNSSLQFYQGTSMAAPHVAGVVALMKSVYPDLSPAELESLLQSGALTTDMGTVGRDDIYGYGLIDAFKSVEAARSLAAGGAAPEPDPVVVGVPAQIPLGAISSATLTIQNIGGGAPQVATVSAPENWLSVTPFAVDASGLGDYSVSVTRDGLVSGTYIGTVSFTFDTAAELIVTVSMQVGDTVSEGGVAQLYAILIDPDSSETIQTVFVASENSDLTYEFQEVPPGTYQLLVGTDIDNDQIICQTGEACGAYPTVNRLDEIVVGENISGLNFTIDLMSSLESLSSMGIFTVSPSPGSALSGPTDAPHTKYIRVNQ